MTSEKLVKHEHDADNLMQSSNCPAMNTTLWKFMHYISVQKVKTQLHFSKVVVCKDVRCFLFFPWQEHCVNLCTAETHSHLLHTHEVNGHADQYNRETV